MKLLMMSRSIIALWHRVKRYYAAGRMPAREFHIRNVTRMQGLLNAVMGVYVLLAFALGGYWWNWSRGWDVVAMVACFVVSAAVFDRVDRYYEEHLPRPPWPVWVWPGFYSAGSAALAIFAWTGHGISGAAMVGAVWMLLLTKYVGDKWGHETTFAATLAVGGVCLLFESALFVMGLSLMAVLGGTLVLGGVVDWISIRKAERLTREEADEFGL